MTHDWGEVVTR